MALSNSAPNLIVTGGAGFIGSNLTLALQEQFPNTRLAIANFAGAIRNPESLARKKDCFGATPKPASETDALPGTNQTGRFRITSYLQLRESDLLGRHRRHLHRPALILLFAKKFFRPAFAGRMRWTGQIFWLLALPSSRLHSRIFSGIGPMGSRIQLQQRNCSRFSQDFLRRSTFPSSQRTGSRTTGLRSRLQDLFNQSLNQSFCVFD